MSEGKQPSRAKRLALRIFGHPSVVLPTAGAGICLTATLVVASPWIILSAAGLGATAIGVSAYRYIFKREQLADAIAQKEKEEILARAQQHQVQRQRDIHVLRQRLASDDEPRDEQLLDQLIELEELFRGDSGWRDDIDVTLVGQVLGQFDASFHSSLKLLEKAFDLRTKSRRLRGDACGTLTRASDQLLTKVEEGITELGRIYAGVQSLSVQRLTSKDEAEEDLGKSVLELHEILQSAQTQEDARQHLLENPDESRYDEYLRESESSTRA